MNAPTARQLEVLKFIWDYTKGRGHPPTIRDIGRELSIGSTNGVNDHLVALEKKGLLARYDMLSRSMRVSSEGQGVLGVGHVCPTCGAPR